MNKKTWETIVFSLAILLLALSFIQGAGMPGKPLKSNPGTGSPSGPDTTQVIAEATSQIPDDASGDLGLLKYLFNRGNKPIIPAFAAAPAVHRSQQTPATARSSRSKPPARSPTPVRSTAIGEDLLRIKVVLGQLPRSALASLVQSDFVAATPKLESDASLVENTAPHLELTQKHDSPDPATTANVEPKGLLALLVHRRPDAADVEVIETPSVDNNRSKTSSLTAAEEGELGLLALLLHHRPDEADVEASETPSGDNNRSKTSVTTAVEKGELGLLALLLHRRLDAADVVASETPSGDNYGSKPRVITAAEKGELGLLALLLHRYPEAVGVEALETPSGENNENLANVTPGTD